MKEEEMLQRATADDGVTYLELIDGGERVKCELYEYTIPGHPLLTWNITLARHLQLRVSNVTVRTPVDRAVLQQYLAQVEVNPAQVEKADTSRPGIAVPYRLDGVTHYMIIDGAHRATKSLREGVTWYVDVLTDHAARRCYKGPDYLMPWGVR